VKLGNTSFQGIWGLHRSQTDAQPARPRRIAQGLTGRIPRRLAVCLVALLIAVLVASYGSPSKSSGATGTPIVLGNIGSYDGSQASTFLPAQYALQAWASSVNASGGIDGHHVDLIIKQDNDTPSLAVSDVNELVQDHAVAIIDFSDIETSWTPAAEQAGIPVLGAGLGAPTLAGDKLFFPSGTSLTPSDYGTLYALKQKGDTKIGIPYCAEVAACSQLVSVITPLASQLGMKVVWSGAFSATAPSYTAQCLAMQQAGVQGVIPAAPTASAIRIATACATQGLHVTYGTQDAAVSSQWLPVPAFNGTLISDFDAPWFEDSTPAEKAFHNALAKYAPSQPVVPPSMHVWTAGQLFKAAVLASGSSNVTSSTVLAGLYKMKDQTLGGLTPPLTFTKGKVPMVDCFFIAGIKNGKFVATDGSKVSCQK